LSPLFSVLHSFFQSAAIIYRDNIYACPHSKIAEMSRSLSGQHLSFRFLRDTNALLNPYYINLLQIHTIDKYLSDAQPEKTAAACQKRADLARKRTIAGWKVSRRRRDDYKKA
jgi:hypothetical protein